MVESNKEKHSWVVRFQCFYHYCLLQCCVTDNGFHEAMSTHWDGGQSKDGIALVWVIKYKVSIFLSTMF